MASPATPEERFALNLRSALAERDISQEALAEAMSDMGHSWHQSTVYKVLTMKRRVGLGEAVDIARVLNIPMEMLISDGDSASLRATALQAVQRMIAARRGLLGAWGEWARATSNLAQALGMKLKDGKWSDPPEEALEAMSPKEISFAVALVNEDLEDAIDFLSEPPAGYKEISEALEVKKHVRDRTDLHVETAAQALGISEDDARRALSAGVIFVHDDGVETNAPGGDLGEWLLQERTRGAIGRDGERQEEA